MRKNPTLAEEKMREYILKDRPNGYKFTRQKPIGSFIVDFYCAGLSLAIEVDGEIHTKKVEYDIQRDSFLSERWITIVRFQNEEIINNADQVYKELIKIIQEINNQ